MLNIMLLVNSKGPVQTLPAYFKTLKDPALDSSGEEAIWAGVLINYYM